MNRSILHCDMNNFYASVECMLDPSLRKYPVAVCGSVEERHGIVLAKNYAAKAFDVKTGDAVWQAKQKCKDLVVVPPHYEEYIKYSKLARNVYSRYTDQVEPYGMDECWLDIKSVQGDSGHAQVKMVTDVYSHILDEDRRLNAQRFEETFYQQKKPSAVSGATVEPTPATPPVQEPQAITEEAMLNYMVQNPDFLQKFKVLLGVGN